MDVIILFHIKQSNIWSSGSLNSITNNEQIIMGYSNTTKSNISIALGSYDSVTSYGGTAIGRSKILSAGNCNAIGYKTCSAQNAVAFGNDIMNSIASSVCLGESSISTYLS